MISGAGGSDQGGDDGAAAGQRTVHRSKISVRHAKQRRQVPDHVPDEVLTLLVSGVSEHAIAALGRRLRLGRAASLTADNITTFRWKILDRRSVSAVVRSLQAEPIVLAAQPNYTYQLGQAAGAARPPSHGRSGRTRLSLNGSKPLISPEASGVDRVIGSGADAPAPEFLGGHPELSGSFGRSFLGAPKADSATGGRTGAPCFSRATKLIY
jgi:hypothetical protein